MEMFDLLRYGDPSSSPPIETVFLSLLVAFAIGQHGLVVEDGDRRGLLLPQVASERRWTRVQFLGQTCRKAGLRADAWQSGATVYRFAADVFGDA